MPSREFTDRSGRRWIVWQVEPTLAERRRALTDERPHPRTERRVVQRPRLAVASRYAGGWLAFQAPGERRRFAPIPALWADASDAELELLCVQAEAARPPRRLVE